MAFVAGYKYSSVSQDNNGKNSHQLQQYSYLYQNYNLNT